MDRKIVYVVGGGTISHIRNHFALCAPAYGGTARRIANLCHKHNETMDIVPHLTRMADRTETVETYEDLEKLVHSITADQRTKIVFFNPAVVDFSGSIDAVASGEHAERLRTSAEDGTQNSYTMRLSPLPKLLSLFRKERKDIFLVGFKATAGKTPEEQYRRGLNMLKASSANLVLANDTVTKVNMIIVPEEAAYHVTTDRMESLQKLVEMAYLRSHLTFTRSTIIDGAAVPWESSLVPETLRTVVDHCIVRGAYQRFRGVTAGHFAVKLDNTTFLTSRRKTDFNDMRRVGLVKIKTNGPDSVIAFGSKPSVGGQSQRIIFEDHPEADCVVHFHCLKRSDSIVPTVSQREFECGSHECGRNTSRGLAQFGNLKAVYLDQHGPNIVFHHSIDPQEVIAFIERNFDLATKSGGYALT